jgi:hypothetical protein
VLGELVAVVAVGELEGAEDLEASTTVPDEAALMSGSGLHGNTISSPVRGLKADVNIRGGVTWIGLFGESRHLPRAMVRTGTNRTCRLFIPGGSYRWDPTNSDIRGIIPERMEQPQYGIHPFNRNTRME